MGLDGADSLTAWHDRVTAQRLAQKGLGPQRLFETQ
jgi:hypothetical protein